MPKKKWWQVVVKKKLEGFILLCIMFVYLKGVRGACTDHFKSNYWYFFISCDGKLALRIFSSAYILFATSPEIGDCKFDSVFEFQLNVSLLLNVR